MLLSLIGVGEQLQLPNLYYDVEGAMSYTAETGDFVAQSVPLFWIEAEAFGVVMEPSDLRLQIEVDNSGKLLGGVAGEDDLVIEGAIDLGWDGTPDILSPLLIGEVVEFGFQDAGVEDTYDFRFKITGGNLATHEAFMGQDIGLIINSPNSTFVDDFNVDFLGEAHGVLCPIGPLQPGAVSGRVFHDANDNGIDEAEDGIADVSVTIAGTSLYGEYVEVPVSTAADGSYCFDGIMPGTYTITEDQHVDYLDGEDSATDPEAVVGDDVIGNVAVGSGQESAGYKFGEVAPAGLTGFVYEDFNDDGLIDFNEYAIENVDVVLTGTELRGNEVSLTATTDLANGIYLFGNLRPGRYDVEEIQPAGYNDGKDTVGWPGGSVNPVADDDTFYDVDLDAGVQGINYNFGERPLDGAAVTSGQTATIGFWMNKNGQELIKSLNGGGEYVTNLGDWLAATFPNMYAALATANNGAVAGFYQGLFKAKMKQLYKGENIGPAKFDCQVMAAAFAVYVTNSNLAGNTAAQYGFLVTASGVGVATFNIGSSGLAFDTEDDTEVSVLDMLLKTDSMSSEGMIYNMDGLLRSLANEVYTAINEAGDIG